MAIEPVKKPAIVSAHRLNAAKHILKDMLTPANYRFLLSGETGIGKTTFVQQIARILGMNLELIEVPHATEEHLIQIPFIVFKPDGSHATDKLVTKISGDNVDVELAQSHLASLLRKFRPISDSEYLSQVAKFEPSDMAIWTALGGTPTTIPSNIQKIRAKWHSILFLDEYWRHTSPQIRNILRGILNKMIGNDKLPEKIYVIYASNMDDVAGTIEEPSMNAQMDELKFQPPTADELLSHLIGKHKNLNPDLIDALKSSINDAHVSYNFSGIESEIRTSPRRWEEVILYLNANIPPKSRHDAEVLLTNVKHMFSNEHGETSDLHRLIDDIVRRVIKAAGSPHHDVKEKDNTEWRHTLEQQLATKMKLGSKRKYVPILSGPPGIGKTQAMQDIAKNLNLVLIPIDSSTLSPETITGLPIPKRQEEVTEIVDVDEAQARLGVEFAPASLYQTIMQVAEDGKEKYFKDPSVSAQKKAEWAHQKYKYILFFDEFNRVANTRTFNSLRRIILDKTFGDGRKVPDDMIIVGAMNPKDLKTHPLTGHIRDAVDIIDSAPNWSQYEQYLKTESDDDFSDRPKELLDLCKTILIEFADTFGLKKAEPGISAESRKFYLNITPTETVYMSPRDYSSLYTKLVGNLSWEWKELPNGREDQEEFISNHMIQTFDQRLNYVLRVHGVESAPKFLDQVHMWIKQAVPQLLVARSDVADLEGMLEATLKDRSRHLKDDPNFLNYAREYERTVFEEEATRYIDKLIDAEQKKYDVWAKNQVSAKKLEKGKLHIVDEMWSKLEAIHQEIVFALDEHNLNYDMIDAFEIVMERALFKIANSVKLPTENVREIVKRGIEMLDRIGSRK